MQNGNTTYNTNQTGFELLTTAAKITKHSSKRVRNCLVTLYNLDKFVPSERLVESSSYEVYQLERCPHTDRLHLQAYVEFPRALSFRQLRGLFDGAHIEERKGSQLSCIDYCSKESTRVSGPWTFGSKKIQGERTDLSAKITLFEEIGYDLNEFARVEPWFYVRFHKGLQALQAVNYGPRGALPTVLWFYGPTGTGKTRAAIAINPEDTYVHSCASKWFDHYKQQEICVFDDVRADTFKFTEWLRLLDRYPHLVEFKGGMIHFNSPVIVITSCYHPKDLFTSERVMENIDQLLRRITEIRHFDCL